MTNNYCSDTDWKEFLTWSSFLKWKEEEESKTYALFCQPKGETAGSKKGICVHKYTIHNSDASIIYYFAAECRTLLYTCCRDGKKRKNVQPRKTEENRKTGVSRKLESGFCIARMTATEDLNAGKVTVEYVSTHTSHTPSIEECKYIPLPPSLRKEVQEKFVKGVTIERIMDGK